MLLVINSCRGSVPLPSRYLVSLTAEKRFIVTVRVLRAVCWWKLLAVVQSGCKCRSSAVFEAVRKQNFILGPVLSWT